MVMRPAILVLLALLLSGCDYFPGPSLGNALDNEFQLSIRYTDGKVMTNAWPSGRVFLIGRGDLPDDSIEEIVVTEFGKVIHHLDREDARFLGERQRGDHINAIWCVDRERIYLFEPKPTDTGGCSKGTLIEEFRNPAKPESRNTEVPANKS